MTNNAPKHSSLTARQRAKLCEALGYIILTFLFIWVTTPAVKAQEATPEEAAKEEKKERNPFLPFAWDAGPASDQPKVATAKDLTISPLSKDPLSTYHVVGLITSPTNEIAVIRNKGNFDYFVHSGDPIGSEGGLIEEIQTDAVLVKVGDDVIHLPVNNQMEGGYETR
jgi:hypothetical protein